MPHPVLAHLIEPDARAHTLAIPTQGQESTLRITWPMGHRRPERTPAAAHLAEHHAVSTSAATRPADDLLVVHGYWSALSLIAEALTMAWHHGAPDLLASYWPADTDPEVLRTQIAGSPHTIDGAPVVDRATVMPITIESITARATLHGLVTITWMGPSIPRTDPMPPAALDRICRTIIDRATGPTAQRIEVTLA